MCRPYAPAGNLVFCEPTMDAREAACARVIAETGATLVPPYGARRVRAPPRAGRPLRRRRA